MVMHQFKKIITVDTMLSFLTSHNFLSSNLIYFLLLFISCPLSLCKYYILNTEVFYSVIFYHGGAILQNVTNKVFFRIYHKFSFLKNLLQCCYNVTCLWLIWFHAVCNMIRWSFLLQRSQSTCVPTRERWSL